MGKGAGGGRLVSAVFHDPQFRISDRLGLSQYLEMTSLRQREDFKLHYFLQKNELECAFQSPKLAFLVSPLCRL